MSLRKSGGADGHFVEIEIGIGWGEGTWSPAGVADEAQPRPQGAGRSPERSIWLAADASDPI